MSDKINWGILGAGKIAGKFATDLATLPEANLYAVASRTPTKAADFAEKYSFQKVFDSYEAMLQDPDLQVVYIATPHVFHCQHSLLCLHHKKLFYVKNPLLLMQRKFDK